MYRNIADWTMFIFGFMAILAGLIGLTSPETMLKLLNITIVDRNRRTDGDFTIGFLICSSMASFNMGIYYLLAAWNKWTRFYKYTVTFRLLTATIFTLAIKNELMPLHFIGIVIWEFLGAIATGLALWYQSNNERNKTKMT